MTDETQIGPRIDTPLYTDYKWFVQEYNDAYKGRLSKEVETALKMHMGIVLGRDLSRVAQVEDDNQRQRLVGYIDDFLDRLTFIESEIGDHEEVREDLEDIKRGEFTSMLHSELDSRTYMEFQDEYQSLSNGGKPRPVSKQRSREIAQKHGLTSSTSVQETDPVTDESNNSVDSDEKMWEMLMRLDKRLNRIEKLQEQSSKE